MATVLSQRPRSTAAACFVATLALTVVGAPAASSSSGGAGLPGQSAPPAAFTSGSGGASPGGLAPNATRPAKRKPKPNPKAPSKKARGAWIRGVTITEYWPVPESWFVGELVEAPGLVGLHRIDWLFSGMGVSMEGEGIGLDGRLYHIAAVGDHGWVTADGVATTPGPRGWSGGGPYWRAGAYWKNRIGGVTFPLETGGWAHGTGKTYVPLPGVTFAPGRSLPLRYYQSIAVDPKLIPLGSLVYLPAYRLDGHGGWFVAQDTGGAIIGRHVDVYRPPPASPSETGQLLTGEKIYVIKAHA
jgi:3D (Asp-Asp-Asp) domain-containing protein